MSSAVLCKSSTGFNTCSSCEEQLEALYMRLMWGQFQYMLLLRGATDPANRVVSYYLFQYMLLLRGATSAVLPLDLS